MDISKYRLKNTSDSCKPPLNSSREQKIYSRELNWRPPRCRTNSISSYKHDSRPSSISPSRQCLPLGLVSTSNANIPIALQKKLQSNSSQRKALVGSLKHNNTYEYKPEKVIEKQSSDMHRTKETVKSEPTKECTFGPFSANKENNYVTLYHKYKILKDKSKTKSSEEVMKCISRLKNIEEFPEKSKGKPPLPFEMDSEEIELRYKRITNKLDKVSKNIQDVINKSSYN